MTVDLSRDEASRLRQENWERYMHHLCILDNHLNAELEVESHRSAVLNHLVEMGNRVKDLWIEFERKSDNRLEDTAVQMAIEQHGLQSHNFHQPQLENKTIMSQSPSKPPEIDCEDVFNQAVSAAIVANGLMTTIQQDNNM